MNKLKELMEKRDALVVEMKSLNEERKFDEFDAKEQELRSVENEIKMLKLEDIHLRADNDSDQGDEVRTLADEVRSAFETKKEVDVTDIEMRDIGMTTPASGGNTSVGNLGKQTFASYILKKLPQISRLYAATRKETLSGASYTIPVQKTKIGKFVNVKEFEEYTKQNADYDQIKLEAQKYGTLVVLSEEALADTAYDIESDIRGQIEEGYAETIEKLIVKGDNKVGVEGLESISDADGAIKVIQSEAGVIDLEEIERIYKALSRKYRKNATWIFNDETAQTLAALKDNMGRPLLYNSLNGEPFGDGSLLLGRPVIVSDEVAGTAATDATGNKVIFFGDLQKALVVGPRKTMTIKVSDEVGFLNDTKVLKVNTRLDIKKALCEAMAYYESL